MRSQFAAKKSVLFLLLMLLSLVALMGSGFTRDVGTEAATPQDGGIQDYCPGPDPFGYRCCQPNYCWVEISGTGTAITGLADDNWVGPLPIGFDFPYYDVITSTFLVESNGYLTLLPTGYAWWLNECPLPGGMMATDYNICILWDDLDFTVSGDAYYQTFATCPVGPAIQCLVVEYSNVAHLNGAPGSAGTWEAVLYDNGDILMQFQDAGVEEGSSSTTGIDGDWSDGRDWGITYACNTGGSITDGAAVLFGFRGDFSCFADCPTAVVLASFEAALAPEGILLTWETESEQNNLGFNLYRSTDAEAMGEQLNEALIPSESPGEGEGASYAFLDETAPDGATSYYTLEDVDAFGRRSTHGPVVLTLWRVYLPLVAGYR